MSNNELKNKDQLIDELRNQLAKQKNYYENIIAKMPGHVYWKDKNCVFLGCNDQQAKTLNLKSRFDVIGKKTLDMITDILPEKERVFQAHLIDSADKAVIDSGKEKVFEEPLTKPNGEIAQFISTKTPLRDEDDNIVGILGISVDITAQKENQKLTNDKEKAEQKAELMKFYGEILNKMPGHVYWKDLDFIYQGCNKNQANNLGFNHPKEIIGKTDFDLSPVNIAQDIRYNDEIIIKKQITETTEETVKDSNGLEHTVLSKKSPLLDQDNNIKGIVGISFDISAEKENQRLQIEKVQLQKEKAEEKAQVMQFYETIIDLVPIHIYWLNMQGEFIGCNKKQALTAGFENKHDMIGKSNLDMPWSKQAEYLDANNEKVIKAGKLITFEEPFVNKDGDVTGYFLSKKQPFKNEKGETVGVMGVSIDITAEKEIQRLQLEKLQQEKEEALRKVELMQILASSIAHELRTPLGALSSYAQGIGVLLPKLLESYKIAKEANLELPFINNQQLDALENSAQSAQNEVRSGFHFIDMLLKNIQQDLKGYSLETLSMQKVVELALERYPFQLNQQHIVRTRFENDFQFNGNEDLMIHVLFNLIKNALFYVGTGMNAEILIEIPATQNNILRFRDNGKGISPENLPHIFKKFYSQSPHGTGIGLAYCKMVLENFNGTIHCDSKPGCYTEFIMNFPTFQGEEHA